MLPDKKVQCTRFTDGARRTFQVKVKDNLPSGTLLSLLLYYYCW